MSTSCTPCPQGQVTNTTGKTSPTDCQGKVKSEIYLRLNREHGNMSLYWLQGFFCLHVPVFHPAPLGKGFFLSWFFQDKDPCIYFANITHHWSMNMIFLFWNSPRFKLAHKWPWKWAKNKMGLTIIVFSFFYLPVSCNIRILDIRCTCNRVFIFF